MKKENVFSFQSSANSQKVDESHRVVGSHFWCKNLKKIFLNIREWVEVVRRMVSSLPLLSCKSSVSLKKNPDRNRQKNSKLPSYQNIHVARQNSASLQFYWNRHVNKMIEYVWNEQSFEKSSVLAQSRIFVFNPLSANPPKWPNTLKLFVGNLPTNCFSVFDHFVKLAL